MTTAGTAADRPESRPGRRRLFVALGWLWVAVLVVAADWVAGRFLPAPPGTGKRPLQPYLVNGDFYDGVPDDVMLAREGPAAYGYRAASGVYVFPFDAPVARIADRGDFLFQDRDALANATGPREVLRVFVIGGSAAYGTGASSPDKRWYAVLERSLSSALGREVRLIPAAMGGYVSTQERLVLDLMVLPRRPDAVVIFDGYNDAALPAMFGTRAGDPYNQGVLYEQFYSPLFGAKRWLARHSNLYGYWVNRSLQRAFEANRRAILASPERRARFAASVASVYLDNLATMLQACRANGIPGVAFLQPARALTLRNLGRLGEPRSEEALTLLGYDEIRSRAAAPSADQALVDLTPLFDGGAPVEYHDTVHFDDAGHRRVAEAMFPAVLDALRRARAREAP
jgi:lysophospholipase L1-like esterase